METHRATFKAWSWQPAAGLGDAPSWGQLTRPLLSHTQGGGTAPFALKFLLEATRRAVLPPSKQDRCSGEGHALGKLLRPRARSIPTGGAKANGVAQATQLRWRLKMPPALAPSSAKRGAACKEPAKATDISGWGQLTLLSLLVLGSVWLTCRSEYLGGFRKGLLISQGTDSVRTNLAGLRRERGEKGMERRGREIERHQSFEGALGVTLHLQTARESLSKAMPRGTSSRSAPAPGQQPAFTLPQHPGYSQTPPGCRGLRAPRSRMQTAPFSPR